VLRQFQLDPIGAHFGGDIQQVHLPAPHPILLPQSEFLPRYRLETERTETEGVDTHIAVAEPSRVPHVLKEKIIAYAGGQLPHAKDTLPALYELMKTDEALKETTAPAHQATAGGKWERLV